MYLPPLHSLRAFEAVARHLHLGDAATELHVTKGAVSLQIKRLEQSTGTALFERGARRLALTAAGETYFEAIHAALLAIERATVQLDAQAARAPLTVSCTPGFAAQWLLPRLGQFEAVAPQVDLRIKASNHVCDFARERIDFAVRHGAGAYPGLGTHKLFDDDLVVVAAPSLRRTCSGPATEAELANYTLLHDEHRGDWRLWLEAGGLPGALAQRGAVLSDSNAVIEAARLGRGLALAPLGMVRADLLDKKLALFFPDVVKGRLAYYLVYPAAAAQRPEAAQFREWIVAACAT